MLRLSLLSTSVASILAILSHSRTTNAAAILDELAQYANPELQRRGSACGYYGTLTCAEDQYCYTDSSNGWALCGYTSTTAGAAAATGAASYQMYTTTYVETDLETITSTWSVAVATTTAATATGTCKASLGETSCGSTCCSSGEFCVTGDPDYCAGSGGGSSGDYSSFYTYTTTTSAASYTAPARGTTVVETTVTSTGSATTTVPYSTPVSTGTSTAVVSKSSSNQGLSGGAIAGIVVGVIIGLLILLLLCLCCCAKAGIDGLLALVGLGKKDKRRTEEVYIEERHSHRASGSGRASGGRTWFGARPSRTEVVDERRTKKSSGFGGLAGVTAGLVGLAAVLGLKRSHDRRRDDEKTEYTDDTSYYTYTYSDTSASSESSDRRTHRTRDTRRSSRR